MPTLVPVVFPAHHQQMAIVAEAPAGTAPASISADLMSTIAIVVAIMLLGFAVSWARSVLSSLWEMTRMLVKPLGVVALLLLSIVVLIGALVASVAGR